MNIFMLCMIVLGIGGWLLGSDYSWYYMIIIVMLAAAACKKPANVNDVDDENDE
jgi:hypothetical protein